MRCHSDNLNKSSFKDYSEELSSRTPRQILGNMNSSNSPEKRIQSHTPSVPTSSSNNCQHFPPDCSSGFWPFAHQLMPPFYTAGIPTMFPPPSPIPVAMPFYYPGALPQFDGNMRVLQHSANNNNTTDGCVRGGGASNNNNNTGNNLMIQFSHQTVNQSVGLPIGDSTTESIVLKEASSSSNTSTQSPSSSTSSAISLNSDSSYDGLSIDYETSIVPIKNHLKLNQDDLTDFIEFNLTAADLAEAVAQLYNRYPCFKKIDSITARLKEDLMRPDGVMANINSQGIAWAVKDLIFAFTRIASAYIILKGYVYNTPEGLNKIKREFGPGFEQSFIQWQHATREFEKHLIPAFLRLDRLNQSNTQRNNNFNSRRSMDKKNNPKHEILENLMSDQLKAVIKERKIDLDLFLCENKKSKKVDIKTKPMDQILSEDGGYYKTYYKTGTFKPLYRPNEIIKNDLKNIGIEKNILPNNSSFVTSTPKYTRFGINTDKEKKNEIKMTNFGEFSNFLSIDFNNQINHPEKLNFLLDNIKNIDEAKYFLNYQFTINYFPDFLVKDSIDIRSIVIKNNIGDYKHVNELVHDLRGIIFTAERSLKKNPQKHLLDTIMAFEKNLNEILSNKMFAGCDFRHITGKPNEDLQIKKEK